MKRKKGSFKSTMLIMVVLPIVSLAIVITITSLHTFRTAMNKEVENNLKNLSFLVLEVYDTVYPGDYWLAGEDVLALVKGEEVISHKYDIIDSMKEQTGADYTIFYYDTRILTTLKNDKGERIVGTGAHALVMKEVFEQQKEHLYSNTKVNGKEYFAYYTPIFNRDGTCIGMIAVAKPSQEVANNVRKAVAPLLLIAIIGIGLFGFISISYAQKVIESVKKIKSFLGKVAIGDQEAELENSVLQRNDELGEIGVSAVAMQRSIRHLVENDSLTGIYNRGSGEKKLEAARNNKKVSGEKIALAIGDIDYFKRVNDTYGHEVGDAVLKNVAQILKMQIYRRGFVARWGGEEFLIVMEGADLNQAGEILQEALQKVRESEISCNEHKINVTMTLGVVEMEPEEESYITLKRADEKLYFGKRHGRNQVVV